MSHGAGQRRLAFGRVEFFLNPCRGEVIRRLSPQRPLWSRPTGFRAHDVRLVAAMQSYGITRLLTFNGAHFRGMPITIIDPASP